MPTGRADWGSTDVAATGQTAFRAQLSFACGLGFRRYDGCQTPVANCEDTEGGGSMLVWIWIGVSGTNRGF